MKLRTLLLPSLLGLQACAPDYLDLGVDFVTTTTGGTTGSGGTGGAPVCTPGVTQECYSGPAGTKGQGTCKPGNRTCGADGTGFGPCEGETLPTKEDCSTLDVDEDCDGSSTCEEVAWSRRAGDDQSQEATTVAVAGDGAVFVGGLFFGTLDLGQFLTSKDGPDAFLVKLDEFGGHLWSRRLGGAGFQEIDASAATGDGGVVVAGTFGESLELPGETWSAQGQQDLFLVCFDSDGTLAWAKHVGGTGAMKIGAVAVSPDGGILALGSFSGTADLGAGMVSSAGNFDIFVVKLDANGGHVWSRRFGDPFNQFGNGLAVGADGSVLMSATSIGNLDFGGGPLSAGFINPDVVVAKLSPAGDHVWSKKFGDANTQNGGPVVVDSAGNIYLAGSFFGSLDFGGGSLVTDGMLSDLYLAKLDAGGAHLWSHRFGDEDMQADLQIAGSAEGGIYLAAGLSGTLDFGGGTLASAGAKDVFLVHFDAAGNYLAGNRFGDAADQTARSMAATPTGYAVVAGSFVGTLDFGTEPLLNAGNYDAFVTKVAP